MNVRHVINLSTAWEPPSAGTSAWVRRFGSPSGVEPGDRVWLVVEGGVSAALVLNGVCLPDDTTRHDVTALLESRNELLLIPSGVGANDPGVLGDASTDRRSRDRCDLDPRYGRVGLAIETRA